MPRVSVEIQAVQLPGGWMWRFAVPADIAPEDPKAAALTGWTGPFASEALAHDHARRTLEHVVREHITATQPKLTAPPAPTQPPPRSPVVAKYARWIPEDGKHFWRQYPRDDVELMGDIWVPEGETFWQWMVTRNGAEIGRGREDSPHKAKAAASKVMTNVSAALRRTTE